MELTQKEERLYEIMKGYAKKDICIDVYKRQVGDAVEEIKKIVG